VPEKVAHAPTQRAVVAKTTPDTDLGLAAFEKRVGKPLQVVEAATPDEIFAVEFAGQRDMRVTLIQSQDGKPLSLPAMYRDGEIMLDVNAPSDVLRRSVLYHELLHGLRDRKGETWSALYDNIARIDPKGLDDATVRYADAYKQATGQDLAEHLKGEEGLSMHAEALGVWLDTALNDPSKFAEVLDSDRTFRERVRDILSRILERLGVKIDSTLQRRIKDLIRDLGKPPGGDAQKSIAMAQRFAFAIDSMIGMDIQDSAVPAVPSAALVAPDVSSATPTVTGNVSELLVESAQAATPPAPAPKADDGDSLRHGRVADFITALRDGKVSASIPEIQRRIGLSYDEASGLMDQLERDGIVGPSKGLGPRKALKPDAPKGNSQGSPEPLASPKQISSIVEADLVDPSRPVQVAVSDVGVDAERFQFKSATEGRSGVRERDMGEAPFDHKQADIVLIWEDLDGKKWIVDGHHRLERAKRSGVEKLNAWIYRESDGVTEAQARTLGAVKNINGGHGDAMDAAKLIRDLGWTENDLKAHGINTRAGLGRNAMGLSKLSDPLFSMIINGELTDTYGQVIGRELEGQPGKQLEAAHLARQLNNQEEVEVAVRRIKTRPEFTSTQSGMFGDETTTRSLNKERAQVETAIRRRLKSERGLFNTLVSKTATAQRIEGTTINRDASRKEANQLDELLDTINRLADFKGPVSEILNDAAKRVAEGDSVGNAASSAIERLSKLDWSNIDAGPVPHASDSKPSGGLFSRGKTETETKGEVGGESMFAVSTHVGPNGPSNRFVPHESVLDLLRRKGQDYLMRPRRIGKFTGVEAEYANLAEAIPGRVREQLDRLQRRAHDPIKAALKRYDIELWEAGRYLYALHAPDANALSKRLHPKKFGTEANPGSGMSNSDAAKIRADVGADTKRLDGFKEIAGIMRGVSKEKLAVLTESGQLTKDGALAWREMLGPNYVTLKDSSATPRYERSGSGFQVKGDASKKRHGRRSKADYVGIVTETLALAEHAIVKAENNRVGQAFGAWVQEVNDPLIAERFVQKEKKSDGADDARGELFDDDETADIAYESKTPRVGKGEALFTFKENGEDIHIIIRDPAKDADGFPLLARSVKRIGMSDGGKVLQSAARLMGILRHLRSSWSPEFFLTNPESDVGGALITIQREQGKNLGRKILKGLPRSFTAAWNSEHKTGKATAWSRLYDDFGEDGGKTGFYVFNDTAKIGRDLQAELDPKNPAKSLYAARDYIDNLNSALENMTRFSIYATMRTELQKQGLSEQKARMGAARIARETTTPFMRKGEWSTHLGMLYLFFNARVQGMHIMASSMKSRQVQKALGVMVAGTFLMTLMNRAIMGADDDGEDKWDKLKRWEKYGSINLAIPGLDYTLKMRAPRMYQPFHVLAVGLADLVAGGLKPSEFGMDILTAAIDGFSPLDSSGSITQAITPTLLQPIVQAATNEGPFGARINPEIPGDPRPKSEQALKRASPSVLAFTRALNELTGGDRLKEGAVSLMPGSVENFLKFAGGGTGQFGLRAFNLVEKAVTGQDIVANDLPLLRKLVAGQDSKYEVSSFYENTRAIEALVYRVKGYIKIGDHKRAAEEREENPGLWRLRLMAKAKEKFVKDLIERLEVMPDGSQARKVIEDRIEQAMSTFNAAVRRETR